MKTKRIFFFLLIISMFTSLSGLVAGCNLVGVRGNGDVKKESRKISSFNGIEVSGAFKVFLKQGSTEELVVETDENILPLVKTEVYGSTLKIETKKPISHVSTLKVYITFKDLNKLDLSGAVDIISEGMLNIPELNFDASGASDTKLDLTIRKLHIDCSGASKIRLNGTAGDVEMDLSGASDILAYDMVAETYDIEISGAGEAQINVTKKIAAEISGAGTVKYKGSPSEIDQNVSGAGSIKKVP
ncbi:MAG: DUF2807 domain-containing protein [Bacteroidales bacterium]|nr:DUF2807 domain-containing protein [Bacteroidales bacterium]